LVERRAIDPGRGPRLVARLKRQVSVSEKTQS